MDMHRPSPSSHIRQHPILTIINNLNSNQRQQSGAIKKAKLMKNKHLSHNKCHVVPTTVNPKIEGHIQRTDTLNHTQSGLSNPAARQIEPDLQTQQSNIAIVDSGYQSSDAILLLDNANALSQAASSRVTFPVQIVKEHTFTKRTGQDTEMSHKEKAAIYNNQFDMLDQYSRLGSSNRMPTPHLNSSKQSQLSEDRSPSNVAGLQKLQQRQSKVQGRVSVDALQDLHDVLDVRVNKGFDQALRNSTREKSNSGLKAAKARVTGGERQSQVIGSNDYTERKDKVHQCSLPDVRKRLKSQQKTRRAFIQNQQGVSRGENIQSLLTGSGGVAATFYGSNSSQVKTLERSVTAGSMSRHAKHRPMQRQKTQTRYTSGAVDKVTPNSSSVHLSHISQRKGVVDLNQQIIQSIQSGVLMQAGARQQQNRSISSSRQIRIPPAGQKHARFQQSNQIKVQIETKEKSKRKKDNEELFIGVGSVTPAIQEKDLTPATVEGSAAARQSVVGTLAEPSLIHSSAVKERSDTEQKLQQSSTFISNKGWEVENEIHSNSSFQTLGIPNSYVRTAKHLSQFKEEDVYSSNKSPLKTIKISEGGSMNKTAQERHHIIVPRNPLPDFVVKSFINTVKSRAQREAKRAGPQNQNPYYSQQSFSRGDECSIVINPFEQHNAYGPSVKKSSLISQQPIPGQLTLKSNTSLSQEPVRSQVIDDLKSPLCTKQFPSFGRESDKKFSTQNRLSSVGSDLDVQVEMFNHGGVTKTQANKPGAISKFDLSDEFQKGILAKEMQIHFDHEDNSTSRIMEQTLLDEYSQISKPVTLETVVLQVANMPTVEQQDIRLKFKLEDSVAKERQKMLKHKLKIERNLENTQSLVEVPTQSMNSSNVFNVQNIKLIPRNERTSPVTKNRAQTAQSATFFNRVSNVEDKTNKQRAPVQQLSSHISIKDYQARRSRKTLSISYLKRYQQQRQKRNIMMIQAPQRQFDIQVQPAKSMVLAQKNPKYSSNLKRKSEIMKHPYGVKAANESLAKWQGDSSSDMQSEDYSLKNHQNTIKGHLEESTRNHVSIRSSSVHTMSREDHLQNKDPQVHFSQDLIQSHERRSPLDLYANKSFKIRKHGKQKSMVYLKNNIPTVVAATKRRESFLSSNHDHHNSSCNCQQPGGGSTQPKRQTSLEGQQSKLKGVSDSRYQPDLASSENMIDFQNPYQMSEEELERLKVKNRSLISQFKSMREANLDMEQESSTITHQKTHFSNQQKEYKSTLKTTEKKSSAVNTSLISGAGDTGKLVRDTGTGDNNLNDDIMLFMEENAIKKMNSLHSVEDDCGSPHIYQPTQLPIGSQRKNPDEFETAQLSSTYRDNFYPISGSALDKIRPISSHESTTKSNKQKLGKPKHKEIRGIMTKVRGFQRQQKHNNSVRKRIYESAGSRTSKLKSKEQFMQTLNVLEPSKFKGRMLSSVDKLKLSKSRENLLSKRKLSSNFDQQEEAGLDVAQKSASKSSSNDAALLSGKQRVQVQADNAENVEILNDIQKVLALAPHEINNLTFKQVCVAQQALYSSLTQLQGVLGNIFIEKQSRASETPMPVGQKQSPTSLFVNRDLKKHIYSTAYKGGWQPGQTRDITTPFSREQQKLRQNYKQMLDGKIDPEGGLASQEAVKAPKIKLIEKSPREAKSVVQKEVDNYYKFKRRQEKAKRKKQRLSQQDKIIQKCSPEEFVVLSQICYLMKKQDLLVEKAKQITTSNFFENKNNESADFEEQMDLMETQKQSLQKFQYQEMFQKKLMPVAQKISSRQSLRKTVNTQDSQDLISAAQDKLATINRVHSGRTNSGSPLQPRFTQNLSKEGGLRSGNVSASYSRQRSKESGKGLNKTQEDFKNASYPNETVMTNLSITLNNEKFSIMAQETTQLSALQNMVKTNSVASTINLYMQKFSSSVTGREINQISLPSPGGPNLTQSKIASTNNLISDEKLSINNLQQAVQASQLIIGQKSLTNKSTIERGEPTGRFITQEDGQQREDLDNLNDRLPQTYENQNIMHIDGQASNYSLLESPVDKFNLIYRNQGSSSQLKLSSSSKKIGQILQSCSMKTFAKNPSHGGSSRSKSQRSGGFQHVAGKKIKSSTLSLLNGSQSLNSDI